MSIENETKKYLTALDAEASKPSPFPPPTAAEIAANRREVQNYLRTHHRVGRHQGALNADCDLCNPAGLAATQAAEGAAASAAKELQERVKESLEDHQAAGEGIEYL